MNGESKSLADSIRQSCGDTQSLESAWNETEAAADFEPLPAGEYIGYVSGGELGESRNGTPRYRVKFTVHEGEHVGRVLTHDSWLTGKALPLAKRDLGKLGISSVADLHRPLAQPVRVRAKVALRTDDDGTRYNRIRGFDVEATPPAATPTAAARPAEPTTDPAPASTPPQQTHNEATRPADLWDDAFSAEEGGGDEELF